MAETGIQTKINQPPVVSPPPVASTQPRGIWPVVKKILSPVASLRLTVVLFVLSILLVFFGTLAQVDQGIWTVVHNYFRSYIAWFPLQSLVVFGQKFFGVSDKVVIPGKFPFPGGWLLGSLLLVNLLAAHLVRFKLSWKRSGILVLHSGLIVMFIGEAVTGTYAVEGYMQIDEGESSNFVTHNRQCELVVIDPSDPKLDDVVAIPEGLLRKGGTIRHPDLPFDIEVHRFMTNSALKRSPEDRNRFVAVEQREVTGFDNAVDVPSVYLTFKDKDDGRVLAEDYLASVHLSPGRSEDGNVYAITSVAGESLAVVPYRPVTANGKDYEVALRFKRTYKPYSLHLIDFRFDRYMGTDKAKNYSSEVRLIDPERNVDRTLVISMNEPLMYRGDAYYQADFDKKTETTTYLQVVRDPGKPLPYLSLPYVACILVSVGMLVHFGINLAGFLVRRVAS